MTDEALKTFDEAFAEVSARHKYDVLAGRAPDFKKRIADTLQEIYDRFIKPIFDGGQRGGEHAGGFGPDLFSLRDIFLAAAVLILAVSLILMLRGRSARKKREREIEEILSDLRDKNVTYGELLRQSRKLAGDGDFRGASRLDYIAVLWVLNEKNIITLADFKTNNRLKEEIKAKAPRFYADFAEIAENFNCLWFGHKLTNAERYGVLRRKAEEIIAGVSDNEKAA
ncbi:MAG: hypothetical protein LBU36_01500 [Clostridiales bacterium]|jgi:hypothetical protein|nr:hypothetical protein [Clostridiales bacterium]